MAEAEKWQRVSWWDIVERTSHNGWLWQRENTGSGRVREVLLDASGQHWDIKFAGGGLFIRKRS